MRGNPPASDIDGYLAGVPEDQRAALEKLRQMIKSTAPEAAEVVSYGVPMFKHHGRPLVSFGATKTGCSFYVMSPEVLEAHISEVKGYKTGKGSISFSPDKPLPSSLVKKLVKARMAEIDGKAK